MQLPATAPLNRLFKMAVTAGVENAVQVHIDRGDNVNARDDKGYTPLMLSAARNRAAICKLLLAAGADTDLLDPSGRDALQIAQAAGATDAAAAIEAARLSPRVLPAADEPSPRAAEELAPFIAPAAEQTASAPESGADQGGAGAGDEEFDLGSWEAEESATPPEGDPSLAVSAREIQAALTAHLPIDTSAEWGDFEAFLPDRATPLLRSEDAEARERLRLLLLRAIREGSVPLSAVEDLTPSEDGEHNAEALAMLHMVINDLGAETDERFEYRAPHENFEVFVDPDEEDDVTGALAFLDDLASGRNDPLRLYQREVPREALLTAEAETALGQAMERGIEQSLDALASWPAGLASILDAAGQVAKGAKPLRWMSSRAQSEPQGAGLGSDTESADSAEDPDAGLASHDQPGAGDESPDSDFGIGADERAGEMAEFQAKIELLCDLMGDEPVAGAKRHARRAAIASLGLTRGFLMELADSALVGGPEPAVAFVGAMRICRLARDKMALANLKLVYSIAKKYMFSGQPLADLLQEGNIGLMKAVDRYDWRKGFRFSTYATWWIRQQVGRFVADKGRTIRLPVHLYEKTQRIAQAARTYELGHSRAPTLEEVAALVNLPRRTVEALSRLALEPLPIHEVPDIDDLVASHARNQFTARDPMELVEDMQLTECVDRFLGALRPKDASVVRMRFGIGVEDAMTLEEIGALLDVTRERVRQIEAKALQRLKHPARLEPLRLELGMIPEPKPAKAYSTEINSDDEAEAEGRAKGQER